MDLIEETFRYVRDVFENEFSGHDFYHTLRVYRLATAIAEKEGADKEVVQLAALLHDVDDRKLSPETCQKKDRAVAFLKDHGADDLLIEKIVTIISEVSYKGEDSAAPGTIEGMCVQDADRLDAIGAIGIARAFAYGGSRNRKIYDPDVKPRLSMTQEEYYASESSSLNHFYEKLFKLEGLMNTAEAKRIARKRTAFMEEYVGEFLKEWDGKDL